MSFVDIKSKLWETLSSIADDEQLKLYDAEMTGGNSFRVFVEGKNGESVTSGDCSRLVHRLMVFFIAEGEKYHIGTSPEIEVSSPGVNRQLRLPEHFQTAVGSRVKIIPQDSSPIKHVAIGELKSFIDGVVVVLDDSASKEYRYDFKDRKKGNLEHLW